MPSPRVRKLVCGKPYSLLLGPMARVRRRVSVNLKDHAGGGSLLAAVLQSNPSMRGILFDLPQVVDGVL